MSTSRDLPANRLQIGQLLIRLRRQFRTELFATAADDGYGDLRQVHGDILGNIGLDGVRLTDLARRAQLSLGATSELVSELEDLGYLSRSPDPTDGRAKVIHHTQRGRDALQYAAERIAEIEYRWAELVGTDAFNDACLTLQRLVDATTPGTAEPGGAASEPSWWRTPS